MEIIRNIGLRNFMQMTIFAEVVVYSIYLFVFASDAACKKRSLTAREEQIKSGLKIKWICVEYFVLLTISNIFIRGFDLVVFGLYVFVCLILLQIIRVFVFYAKSKFAVKLLRAINTDLNVKK